MVEYIRYNKAILNLSVLLFVGLHACNSPIGHNTEEPHFGALAKKESSIPVRPGIPGERPFWNSYSKRFIYAPAFDYQEIKGAVKYRYKIYSQADSSIYSFEAKTPYAALSRVWADVPIGTFLLNVIGLSSDNDSLGLAGSGKYYRASPFNPANDSVYHAPAMPYVNSAKLALQRLMSKKYVTYWLDHKSPDPHFTLYRYPSKIMAALISGAVLYAQMFPNTDSARQARKIAEIVADYLLSISSPEDAPLAYCPPTYYGYAATFKPESHMQYDHTMMIYPALTGSSYLDIYDLTKDEKYLIAAKHIAQTYINRQLESGTWYLFVNNKTGKPVAENLLTPTKIIRFFIRLKDDYQMPGLSDPIQKAINWIMEHPVKTFNWQGQFEDVGPTPPYKDLSKLEVCNFAVYLYKSKKYLQLAEELTRFTEDQFVVWEKPEPKPDTKELFNPKNWMIPCAQEQYAYWVPINGSVANVIRLYQHAYMATHKKIYLAKAKSLANSVTLVQQVYDGDYPTYFFNAKFPKGLNRVWLNASVFTIETMYGFGRYLDKNDLMSESK